MIRSMSICVRSGETRLVNLRTRMPFKYGIATMTDVPYAFLQLVVEVDGHAHIGTAADNLPPKWFTKDPARPLGAEMVEMLRVIEHARQCALTFRAPTPFAFWQELHARQLAWGRSENLLPLLTGFGTSMVERAVIEACCRARQSSFAALLQADAFGLRLDAIHPELTGTAPADWLPAQPLSSVFARHTVGLVDPLTEEDIPAAEKLDDGLPQSLAACIAHYGLRHFKIKVSGNPETDLARLCRIAALLLQHAPADFAFTLDGNEQFHSNGEFQDHWQILRAAPELRALFPHMLFVEQPVHRSVALTAAMRDGFAGWADAPPVIIDESDDALDSLPTALALGYAGTSHKNCKGIFKGIANRCLVEKRSREGRRAIMSGEDLCTIGPVSLLQDLCVMSALGIASVERNGHHYHRGLSQLPQSMQRGALEHHADLYRASRDGWPTLQISDGRLALDSVNRAPFGVGFTADLRDLTPAPDWQAPILP